MLEGVGVDVGVILMVGVVVGVGVTVEVGVLVGSSGLPSKLNTSKLPNRSLRSFCVVLKLGIPTTIFLPLSPISTE